MTASLYQSGSSLTGFLLCLPSPVPKRSPAPERRNGRRVRELRAAGDTGSGASAFIRCYVDGGSASRDRLSEAPRAGQLVEPASWPNRSPISSGVIGCGEL